MRALGGPGEPVKRGAAAKKGRMWEEHPEEGSQVIFCIGSTPALAGEGDAAHFT